MRRLRRIWVYSRYGPNTQEIRARVYIMLQMVRLPHVEDELDHTYQEPYLPCLADLHHEGETDDLL